MFKAPFAGENYIARVRYVLKAVGDGQSIGFDVSSPASAMLVNHRGTRRVVFHAKRLIHHGEEMMYNYGEDFAKNIGKRLI